MRWTMAVNNELVRTIGRSHDGSQVTDQVARSPVTEKEVR